MKGRTTNSAPKAYDGKGTPAMAEAMDKKDMGKFKRGGAVRVEGSKAKARLDRGGKSPFSRAHSPGQSGGHKATDGDA